MLPAAETSVTGSLWESVVLLKDKEIFRQLTSECELVSSLKEDIFKKFCDKLNNLE